MSVANQLLNAINKSTANKSIMINGVRMQVVHASEKELDDLDKIQGGSYKHNGIPEYSRIAPLIQIPQVRQVFIEVAKMAFGDPKQTRKINNQMDNKNPVNYSDHPMPNRLAHEVADKGNQYDKKIAYFPVALCEFLNEHVYKILHPDQDGPPINSQTGLVEYNAFGDFFGGIGNVFKGVVKGVGSLVSGMGPMLPAIGGLTLGPLGALGGSLLGGLGGALGGGEGGMGLPGMLGNMLGGLGNPLITGLSAMLSHKARRQLAEKTAAEDRLANSQIQAYVRSRGFR